MSGNFLASASALSLAFFLAACGGNESSDSLSGLSNNSNSSNNSSGQDGNSSAAASIHLITASPQIGSAGSDQTEITAIVKDDGGVTLSGVPVNFSANDATITVINDTTDELGTVNAVVSAQGSKANRTAEVTATASQTSASTMVSIVGTSITLDGPTTIPLNQPTNYSIKLRDSAGDPIADQTINIQSSANNSISPSTGTSDSNGSMSFTYEAASGGEDTLTVRAFEGDSMVSDALTLSISPDTFVFESPEANQEIPLNTSQTIEVSWETNGTPVADGSEIQFSATRGTLTPANGLALTSGGKASVQIESNNAGLSSIAAAPTSGGPTIQTSVEFVATTPSSIYLQASKTQISPEQSTDITATIRDANDNLVKNASVNFQLNDSTGGYLSSSTGTTDSQGQTQVTYFAGSSTSSKDGVEVTATVGGSLTDSVYLTVGGQALRINIGTGNEISEASTTVYSQPWTVIVTDANGNAAGDQLVELSVTSVSYVKGIYDAPDTDAGEPDGRWHFEPATVCASEDVNNNGSLDTGEDTNSNGSLEPNSSAATPSTVTTSSDGIADFDLTYLKSECSWVEVNLRAVTRVGGTESDASQQFTLPCLAADLAYNSSNPIAPAPGTVSPYGSAASCADPN
ncbi:MAG: Ig-like domain-containing protein [Marinobacter sp.]|uniref:Ig-like domain-containing protein n=1 Tax=Marinobacter sp. TaxID=50741 RepID=UPI00299F49A2|nr:Ig-like domain-containing protein [Marinobacter sp.]MDX1757553.1 Ig-like domain-containing protein [Marinobacter sp.]